MSSNEMGFELTVPEALGQNAIASDAPSFVPGAAEFDGYPTRIVRGHGERHRLGCGL